MLNPSLEKYQDNNQGYFAISLYNKEKSNWKDHYFNNIELANEFINNNKDINNYSSVAKFKTKYRNSSNVLEMNELFVDIDNHLNPLSEEQAKEFVSNTLEPLFDVAIPIPSLVNYTGRGLHLHFNLKGASDSVKWQYIENAMVQTLENICQKENALFNVYGLEIDKSTSDKARVLRNSYTLNTESKTMCVPIFHSDYVYTQEEIIECFNLAFTIGKGKSKQEHKLEELKNLSKDEIIQANSKEIKEFKQYNPYYTQETINQERKQDLLKLIELRNNAQFNEGYRGNLLGILAQIENKSTKNKGELYERLQGFNQYFNEPLRECEVRAWVNSACKNTYYNFTNAHIIKKLSISEEEQANLSIILSKKVKNRKYYLANQERLKARRNERYNPIKFVNKGKRNMNIILAKQLKAKGYTQKEIAKELGKDQATISRYLKNY